MNEIKVLLKHTKYILPALTFLSICKLVLFYFLFRINISEYISLDEILTPFIGDALKYLFFFFIPFVIMSTLFFESIGRQNVAKYDEQRKLTRTKRFLNNIKKNWILWFSFLVITIILIIKKQPLEFILSTVSFIPFFMIIMGIRGELLMKHNFEITNETSSLLNISTLLILMFVMTISNAFLKSYQIKYRKNPVVYIQMINEAIVCKDSISYIGRTKNYTFIYNRRTKSTTAIENSEIKKLTIQ